MVNFEGLVRALEEGAPGPCGGCEHRRECGDKELACSPFVQFVIGKQLDSSSPRSLEGRKSGRHFRTRAFYREIFPRERVLDGPADCYLPGCFLCTGRPYPGIDERRRSRAERFRSGKNVLSRKTEMS